MLRLLLVKRACTSAAGMTNLPFKGSLAWSGSCTRLLTLVDDVDAAAEDVLALAVLMCDVRDGALPRQRCVHNPEGLLLDK